MFAQKIAPYIQVDTSSKSIMNTVLKVKDRGAFAAVLTIALVKKGNTTSISYLNPDYVFNAYLRSSYDTYESTLSKVSINLKEILSSFGTSFSGFGGALTKRELRKYHYKVMMPYFSNPVTLK